MRGTTLLDKCEAGTLERTSRATFLRRLVFGSMDYDDPVVRLVTPVEVVGAKTPVTVEARDDGSGLKEVKITFAQEGQEKVVLEKKFPPGGDSGETVEIPFTLEPKALGFKEGKATLTAQVRDRSWRNMFRGRTSTIRACLSLHATRRL